MEVTHPLANRDTSPPEAVSVAPGESYDVVDGVVDVPDAAAERLADVWAARYDVDAAALLDHGAATCDAVKSDGEVCGRELPCQYHSDSDSDDAETEG